MKKIIISAGMLLLSLVSFSQEKIFIEQSLVVNVEVPLRVFHRGEFVDNLSLNDFEVFENGIPQKVEALYLVKRRSIERSEEKKRFSPSVARNFFLMFEISEYTAKLNSALEYFVNNVIMPGDKVYLVSPLKSYRMKPDAFNVISREEIFGQLKKILRKDATQSSSEYRSIIRELTALARAIQAVLATGKIDGEINPQNPEIVVPKELDSIEGGSYAGLALDEQLVLYAGLLEKLDTLRSVEQLKLLDFARFLKGVEGQKYVYLFYEREFIPQIEPRLMGQFRDFFQNRPDVTQIISTISDFYTRDISFNLELVKQAYADSSISIHFLVYTKPEKKYLGVQLKEHSEDIFSAFKQMAQATGGFFESSANPQYLFRRAVEASENYYLLYYSPKNYVSDGKFREIKVRVKGKNYRVIHRGGYFAN
ncbi:MAG: hypothetical protein ACE5LC_07605 [Candidatus Aminicenantales bacterium]